MVYVLFLSIIFAVKYSSAVYPKYVVNFSPRKAVRLQTDQIDSLFYSLPGPDYSKKYPINYTGTLEKYWSKLSNYNITNQELEVLYGNRANAGLVATFAGQLLSEGGYQMMFNEIRRHFQFKPQKLRFNQMTTREERLVPYPAPGCKDLDRFQGKMLIFKRLHFMDVLAPFRQEDTDRAERFLDEKLPELRQIYRTKSREIAATLTKNNIEQIFGWFPGYALHFSSLASDIISKWNGNAVERFQERRGYNSWTDPLNSTLFC